MTMAGRFVLSMLVGVGVLFISCTAMQQQKRGEASSASVSAGTSSGEFKNLKLLRPANREELITIMKGYSQALGVRCDFCHVPLPGSEKLDFPSDANSHKGVARVMITMTRDINGRVIEGLPGEPEGTPTHCMTCHRGKKIPDIAMELETLKIPPPPAAPGTS